MAKTQNPQTPQQPPDQKDPDDQAREDLYRELGLDDFSHESCIRDLFGDLYTLGPAEDEPATGDSGRVTQMGPGRRNQPDENE
ncbi:hypothetical protein [Enhygromyxa salina]|uniref:Uncharacterized protein n=1 Tax=Enhygromyxa salina TaxID=215803 RepID=A0A2S9Y0M9_9BACT|nr:hypothetical protein [Enhygromyxa salina]PRP98530.1 hypothetical protein ENSA7_64730 [Enhygromyxa salina]